MMGCDRDLKNTDAIATGRQHVDDSAEVLDTASQREMTWITSTSTIRWTFIRGTRLV